MSLFVLREGYRVITTEKGGRVMHVRTGDQLELSATEVQLLARATAGGVDPEDPSVKPVFKKLANLGLLVKEPGVEKPKGNVPAFDELSIDLDDVVGPKAAPTGPVPKFRTDVAISRRGTGNLFDAADPVTGTTLSLYDFEVSLARMLDGKRTHAELLEAAKKLGIPASADSLAQFLKQLEKNGFLVSAGTPERPGSAWPERQKWPPHVRQHFQLGLKLSREGRYNEAILAFELVLAEDPANPEATEAIANARVHIESLTGVKSTTPPPAGAPLLPAQSPPRIPSVQLPPPLKAGPPKLPSAHAAELAEAVPTQPAAPAAIAPAPASYELDVPEPTQTATAALVALPGADQSGGATSPAQPALQVEAPAAAPVEDSAPQQSHGPGDEAPAPARAPETSPRSEAMTELEVPAARRGVPLPLFVGSLVAALALGWFVGMKTAPSPAPTVVPPVTTGPTPVREAPPRPTAVAPAVEDAGAAEASGVAIVDAGALAVAEPVDAGAPPVATPEEVAEASVDSGKPTAAPAETPAPAGEWIIAKIVKRGRVTMGTIEASAAGTVAWTAAKQAEVKRGAVVGRLTTDSGKVDLTAPKAGIFKPTAADGATVAAGAPLASIVYVEGFIQATVDLATPFPAWACEVADKSTGQTAPCRVVTATPKGKGLFITATTDPLWFDASAAPELRLAAAP